MYLETKRLILRAWENKDVNDLIEGLNNIEVSKWLAMVPFPYDESHALYWINHCKKIWRRNQHYALQKAYIRTRLKLYY